jgi:predicted nuclease of predicted toxin-antitoxin system
MPAAGPRLLSDENLSSRLVEALAAAYPDSTHVEQVGLRGAPDLTIWEHARMHGHVLVTRDEDFHRLSVVRGFPPKVVWIRLGNCTTREVAALLRRRTADLVAFVADDEAGFLALG